MNWKPGPARCRSDEYEAEILATDMGEGEPILYRVRKRPSGIWLLQRCGLSGRINEQLDRDFDLLPPRLTLEEAARECEGIRVVAFNSAYLRDDDAMLAALQHYEKMKEEGRV